MTNGKNTTENRTSRIGNILDMIIILIFPFLGMKEITDDQAAAAI